MHKTVSASIGNALFTVEESAYAALEAYLESIRAHFTSHADADEIVADIEDRIAEEFSDALGTRRKVILKKDVDAMIARMGTVEDFRTFDGDAHTAPEPEPSPSIRKLRLYRDTDNQILGGVCAGIANFFGIDPIIVRLLFGLSVFLGGFGIVLYILLWIILPEAKTASEKVEMTGGRVTLASIQERIDVVMPPEKRRGILARIVRAPFVAIGIVLRAIGRTLRILLPVLMRIIGVVLMVVGSCAIAASSIAFFAVLLNPGSPYIGFPLLETVGFASYVALIGAGYFAIFLPLLLILLLGASLVMLRNIVTGPAIAGMAGAWLIAIVAGGVTLFGVAPVLEAALEEHNDTVTRTFDVDAFDGIMGDGIERITVTRGDTFSVRITGTELPVSHIRPVINDGVLSLKSEPWKSECWIFCASRSARAEIVLPSLTRIEAHNASRIDVSGFSGAAVSLVSADIARLSVDGQWSDVTASASDASVLTLAGTTTTLHADATDISRIDAADLRSATADVSARDASRIAVDASLSLTGTVSDIARIAYEGEPDVLTIEQHDAGHVERL